MSAESSKRIFVVEDDLDIRDTFRQLLELEGYLVTTASNGREALDLLRRGDVRPNLILLDLMMPIMNGWEFLDAQRQDASIADIPVVVVTAAGKDKEKTVGAAGFIKKPVELELLLDTVKKYC